jgi:hypothetical protein
MHGTEPDQEDFDDAVTLLPNGALDLEHLLSTDPNPRAGISGLPSPRVLEGMEPGARPLSAADFARSATRLIERAAAELPPAIDQVLLDRSRPSGGRGQHAAPHGVSEGTPPQETAALDPSLSGPADAVSRQAAAPTVEAEVSSASMPSAELSFDDLKRRRRRIRIVVAALTAVCGLGLAAGAYFAVTWDTEEAASRADQGILDAAVADALSPARDRALPADTSTRERRDAEVTRRDGPAVSQVKPDATVVVSSVEKGRLRVATDPPLAIYLRSRQIGRGSVNVSLKPGRYRLALIDRTLGVQLSRVAVMRSGSVTRVTVKLGQGKLVVKVRPWAHVFVDGVKRGTTPMAPIALYQGTHSIKLATTGKPPIQKRVTIKPGATVSITHRF